MEVYLDHSATTRCYEEVKELVVKTMMEDYGNPLLHAPERCGSRKLSERGDAGAGRNFESAGKRDLFYIRRDRIE